MESAIENKGIFWRAFISFLSGAVFYLFMGSIIIYSIYQVSNGQMTVDVFLLLYQMAQSMSNMIQTMAFTIQMTENSLFNLNRQRVFIEGVPKCGRSLEYRKLTQYKDAEIALRAKDLCFSYHDSQEVLHHLNFEIKEGETIALVGCNGSGKSTLVNFLTNLYQPNSGTLMHRFERMWGLERLMRLKIGRGFYMPFILVEQKKS